MPRLLLDTPFPHCTIVGTHPFYGSVHVFDRNDTISRCVIDGDEWEPYINQPMAEALVDGTDMMDLGANLGLSTIGVLARLPALGKTCRLVHAFEMQPDVTALLRLNTRRHPNVRVYQMAVSSSRKLLAYSRDDTNIGGATVFQPIGGAHLVPAWTLDELLDGGWFSHRVSLVKIDVEGHEDEVLEGGRRFIAEHQPTIFIEIQPERFTANQPALEQIGYKITQQLSAADYVARPAGA